MEKQLEAEQQNEAQQGRQLIKATLSGTDTAIYSSCP